ncbi:MAG: helix-turn-helix transcriptional regulator [Methylobacteriaceae bacterium]|nr:helix-turn-helix transcriptional regulator [Methylobacteriaceae bacterium]
MLYAAQLRAGRALLGWRQDDLAKRAGVGLATVQRIEQSGGIVTGNARTIWKLQATLEGAGVQFSVSPGPVIGVSCAIAPASTA